ncbi:MAG TPA: tryptophan--tRNA ligase [Gemmatimonadales bacterium]|nr:tryptophan--tRNA ligase [Gemmatimonadales bacterium]
MARIFSGIQPSGELHVGNWLGAVQNWVDLQSRHDCLICIVDLHALTGARYVPEDHARLTREMALSLLAAGIDPERATLFVQSHVPEHSELMWLLNAVTPVGELERMTQYKDRSVGLKSIPAALLNYPILMAADILLYQAELVPVGEDQLQHLELAREVVRRFATAFGRAPFPEPQPLVTPVKRVMGLDGRGKMSKSRGNTIGILDSPEVIWQRLRPAVTDPARVTRKDPGTPEICNIYHLHQSFSPADTVAEVARKCRGAEWGCLDCKRVLAGNIAAAFAPMRERAAALEAEPHRVDEVLRAGAARARSLARATLREVREAMGFLTPEDDG